MITHKGTQLIRTKRLLLRRFSIDDANDMYNNWANDERVTKYLTWRPHASADDTRILLENWCGEYIKYDYYNWLIEYNNTPIGNISVVRMDNRSEYAELGYCMGYNWWNLGLMTETASAVIDFLFNEIGFNRIGIAHAVKNPASGRVAQKCGLTYEGTKRQYFKAFDGEFHDIAEYAILKSEHSVQ